MQVYKALIDRIKWYTGAIRIAWQEKSFKFGAFSSSAGIVVGVLLNIGMTHLVLLVAIAIIGLALEIVNSATEQLCDLITKEYDERIKIIKDAYGAIPAITFSCFWICWLIVIVASLT